MKLKTLTAVSNADIIEPSPTQYIYVIHKMKTIRYCFVCSDSAGSVLKLLGLSPSELKPPLLELQVGDTITFENVLDLALVVTSRWMKIGQDEDQLAYMVDLAPFPV